MNALTRDVFAFDPAQQIDRIAEALRRALRTLRKRGLVIGVSGGIDSAVTAALAARAIGPSRVFALLLPDRDGARVALARARGLVAHLGLPHEERDISATLECIGCYARRDDAIRTMIPEYTPDWACKIAIAGGIEGRYNVFRLVARPPDGRGAQREALLPPQALLAIVAAMNFKQRVRKAVEYGHADRLNYAVLGSANRLEHDQGFFVKNGDGAADVKPIAHLYKTQVYTLGRALGLPEAITSSAPTTDTYSLPQGQDEFYFALPWHQMDYALWAYDHGIPPERLAEFLRVPAQQGRWIYRDIDAKRRAAEYLHRAPIVVEASEPVHG